MPTITDQELLDALTTASSDARAVLGLMGELPEATGFVTVTLSNGVTFSIKGLAAIAAERVEDQQGYALDFSGASPCTVTYLASGKIDKVVTTFQSGLKLEETNTYNARGQVATTTVVLKDASNVTLATKVSTYNRNAAGRIISVTQV